MNKDEEFNDWLCEREDGIGYSSFNKRETADEMFEELGYKKDISSSDEIIEYYKYEGELEDDLYIIRFYIDKKTVWKNSSITMQELQAINKKCQEWSWYNERK